MPDRRLLALLVAGSLAGGALLAGCGGGDGGGTEVTLSAAGERGRQVADDNGCFACHTTDGSKGTGPTWEGLYGSEVELKGGETVTADDAYLTNAILRARDETVEGYANIMPVYEGKLTDEEVADLLAYLRDLAPEPTEG